MYGGSSGGYTLYKIYSDTHPSNFVVITNYLISIFVGIFFIQMNMILSFLPLTCMTKVNITSRRNLFTLTSV